MGLNVYVIRFGRGPGEIFDRGPESLLTEDLNDVDDHDNDVADLAELRKTNQL